jgi:hypothetical protein
MLLSIGAERKQKTGENNMPGQKGRTKSEKDRKRFKSQKGRSISDKDIERILAAGNVNSRRNRQEGSK